MNKEYDNTNTGALFLADKLTKNGDKYFNGNINAEGKEYQITMFTNNSDNPKAPKFRIKVNVQNGQAPQENKDKVYSDFGNEIELTDDDIDLAF